MEPNQNMDPAMQGATPDMTTPPTDANASQEMATPEEKQSLIDMLSQIEQKYRDMNASKFAGDNQSASIKQDLLVDVFKTMQDNGIDVTNVESVRQFLDNLEQSNPDLYQLFVDAFNGLMGDQNAPAAPEGTPTPAATGMEAMAGAPGMTPPTTPATPTAPATPTPSSPDLAGMLPPTGSAPAGGGPGPRRWQNLAR